MLANQSPMKSDENSTSLKTFRLQFSMIKGNKYKGFSHIISMTGSQGHATSPKMES